MRWGEKCVTRSPIQKRVALKYPHKRHHFFSGVGHLKCCPGRGKKSLAAPKASSSTWFRILGSSPPSPFLLFAQSIFGAWTNMELEADADFDGSGRRTAGDTKGTHFILSQHWNFFLRRVGSSVGREQRRLFFSFSRPSIGPSNYTSVAFCFFSLRETLHWSMRMGAKVGMYHISHRTGGILSSQGFFWRPHSPPPQRHFCHLPCTTETDFLLPVSLFRHFASSSFVSAFVVRSFTPPPQCAS